jgi:hypothetical protein
MVASSAETSLHPGAILGRARSMKRKGVESVNQFGADSLVTRCVYALKQDRAKPGQRCGRHGIFPIPV